MISDLNQITPSPKLLQGRGNQLNINVHIHTGDLANSPKKILEYKLNKTSNLYTIALCIITILSVKFPDFISFNINAIYTLCD